MSLTKKEKRAVLRAIRRVFEQEHEHSCWALEAYDPSPDRLRLRNKYADFFDQPKLGCWPYFWDAEEDGEDLRGIRLTCLSLFLAADGSID